jgi:hypothetical protein
MSVKESEVVVYGSANMPEDDVSTVGGAVSFSTAVFFGDLVANSVMNVVSSSASDTAATLAVTGRSAGGIIQTDGALTLNGTTPVAGTLTHERLLKAIAAGTAAVGDLAAISATKVISNHTATAGAQSTGTTAASIGLQTGDGASVAVGQIIRIINNSPAGVNFQLRRIIRISGDIAYVNRDWTTLITSASTYDVHTGLLLDISPNQITKVRRAFYGAAANAGGGASKDLYEKIFYVNNNTTIALTLASIIKQVDPSAGTLQIAVCKALNDTATAANRATLPANGDASALTFTAGAAPQSQNVPSPQNLPSGAAPNTAGAEGVWLKLTLAAGLAATKTTYDVRATGQTT